MARIAGIEVETKVSLTGALAVVLAFCGVVGGWYRLDARITASETAVAELKEQNRAQAELNDRLRDTLDRVNNTLGVLHQKLEDTKRCDCPSHQ